MFSSVVRTVSGVCANVQLSRAEGSLVTAARGDDEVVVTPAGNKQQLLLSGALGTSNPATSN